MPRKVPFVRIDVGPELARRLQEERRVMRPVPTMKALVEALLWDALSAADFRRVRSRAGEASPVLGRNPAGGIFLPDPHHPPEPLEPEPEEPAP